MKKRSGDSSRLGDVGEMLIQKPPLGTPLDWENPLNKGTVMALAMNEGHGDKAQDLSLNGNHGTLNNFTFPPTTTSGWNPGQTGIVPKLDGIDDHIDCGHNTSLNRTGAITISMLVYPTDLATEESRFANKPASFYMYQYGAGSGRLRVTLYSGATAYSTFTPNNVLKDSEWQHIAFTWDKAIDGGVGKLYWNGNETIYSTQNALTTDLDATTNNLTLGYWATTYSQMSLDQPRIQSRAWSAKEVKDYAINPWQVYEQ